MLKELATAEHGMSTPECQQFTEKTEQGRFLFHIIPIHPAQCVVMTIRIVVPALAAANLVTHQQHWNPTAQEKNGRGVPHLALPKGIHARIGTLALPTTIPAVIIVGAVTVPLAVGLVVFAVVRDHVTERESVVAGDEVHACRRTAVPLQIRRPLNSVGDLADHAFVALNKAPDRVAILAVPFRPSSVGGK